MQKSLNAEYHCINDPVISYPLSFPGTFPESMDEGVGQGNENPWTQNTALFDEGAMEKHGTGEYGLGSYFHLLTRTMA